MRYPGYAKELARLLQEDQEEKRAAGRTYFHEPGENGLKTKLATLKRNTRRRTERMCRILGEIGEPSISNIGVGGAQAVSVLALHDGPKVLRRVLAAFTVLYERSPEDTFYQAIPSMTDAVCILERKPQQFGTQWLLDKNKYPFLPTVEDFVHVNQRRAAYDIEPLRWPKSLAVPESEQPWLKRPLSELVMREPTEDELRNFAT